MSGIEAITHHNGWAMAIVGATIVLSGLTILSLIISQIHKLVLLLEKKSGTSTATAITTDGDDASGLTVKSTNTLPSNIETAIEIYRPLIEELEEHFKLADLYILAEKYHLPHPHLSIRCLREAGKLESLGGGVFRLVA